MERIAKEDFAKLDNLTSNEMISQMVALLCFKLIEFSSALDAHLQYYKQGMQWSKQANKNWCSTMLNLFEKTFIKETSHNKANPGSEPLTLTRSVEPLIRYIIKKNALSMQDTQYRIEAKRIIGA